MKKPPNDQSVPVDDPFEVMANASVDGLLVIDSTGVVQFANPAALAMFAEEVENLVGFHFGIPAAREPTKLQLPRKGKTCYVEMRTSEISWNARKATLASLRDITTEEALRASDQTKRVLLDATTDTAFLMDTSGKILAANDRLIRHLGQGKQAVIGNNFYSLLPPELTTSRKKWVEQVIRTGKLLTKEYEHPDMVSHSSLYPFLDEAGCVSAVAVYGRDITNQKEREARIALLGQMLDEAPTAITIHNTEGTFLFSNRQNILLHGYDSKKEFLNLNLDQLDVPRSKALQDERFQHVAEHGKTCFEVEHYRKDGSTFPLEVTAKAIEWKGKPAILSIATDITTRKQAEATKEEQKALLEAIYRDAPLMMMVVDSKRRVQQINGFASQFANRSTEEMLGSYPGEALHCIHALQNAEGCGFGDFCNECIIRNTVLDTLANGNTNLQVETDYYPVPADGRPSPMKLLLSSTPLVFKGEHMALVTMLDISERMALKTQLQQAQKMESVGRLAGGVAHDFNNLLMGIMGYTELCRETLIKDHPAHELLDEIEHGAQRSSDLTRQLLTFASRQTIAPKVLDLNDTVSEMLKMLRRIIGEDIDLSWLPGTDLFPIKVDPGQIDQILANLCVNARDALNGVGKVTIETKNANIDPDYCARHVEATPGAYVMMVVSDDGCGMDRETLRNVFEPFFTTKPTGEGTGLGLATVYGIVKQSNGFVNVYSEPDNGTTFRIYLPACADTGVVEPDTEEKQPYETALDDKTILLVEDEKSIRFTTAAFLKKLGYKVLVAENPEDALAQVRDHENPIDLLITDVVMPGMSGHDLAEKLAPDHPDMKILYISGYTANVIAHRGIIEENIEFLGKPFRRSELAKKARQILE